MCDLLGTSGKVKYERRYQEEKLGEFWRVLIFTNKVLYLFLLGNSPIKIFPNLDLQTSCFGASSLAISLSLCSQAKLAKLEFILPLHFVQIPIAKHILMIYSQSYFLRQIECFKHKGNYLGLFYQFHKNTNCVWLVYCYIHSA